MNELGLTAQKLNMLLKPMVSMIVKEIRPKEDDLSINAAYKIYGRRWIEAQRRAGNLKERHMGNKKYLSRADIELLRSAELDVPQLVFRANSSNGYESHYEGGKLVIKKAKS